MSGVGNLNNYGNISSCYSLGSVQAAKYNQRLSFSDIPDEFVSNTNSQTEDNADDGKITLQEKALCFGKGLISPITSMFSSPKNFAIGAAMIVGGAALIAATGGAAAPLLVGIGVLTGGIQLGKGVYKASTAQTDEEAREAWNEIGSGTSFVGLSVLGAKSSVAQAETAGVKVSANAKDLNAFEATLECFKAIPSSISKSFSEITNNGGKNFSAFLSKHGLKNAKPEPDVEPKNTPVTEPETPPESSVPKDKPAPKTEEEPVKDRATIKKELKLKARNDLAKKLNVEESGLDTKLNDMLNNRNITKADKTFVEDYITKYGTFEQKTTHLENTILEHPEKVVEYLTSPDNNKNLRILYGKCKINPTADNPRVVKFLAECRKAISEAQADGRIKPDNDFFNREVLNRINQWTPGSKKIQVSDLDALDNKTSTPPTQRNEENKLTEIPEKNSVETNENANQTKTTDLKESLIKQRDSILDEFGVTVEIDKVEDIETMETIKKVLKLAKENGDDVSGLTVKINKDRGAQSIFYLDEGLIEMGSHEVFENGFEEAFMHETKHYSHSKALPELFISSDNIIPFDIPDYVVVDEASGSLLKADSTTPKAISIKSKIERELMGTFTWMKGMDVDHYINNKPKSHVIVELVADLYAKSTLNPDIYYPKELLKGLQSRDTGIFMRSILHHGIDKYSYNHPFGSRINILQTNMEYEEFINQILNLCTPPQFNSLST